MTNLSCILIGCLPEVSVYCLLHMVKDDSAEHMPLTLLKYTCSIDLSEHIYKHYYTNINYN